MLCHVLQKLQILTDENVEIHYLSSQALPSFPPLAVHLSSHGSWELGIQIKVSFGSTPTHLYWHDVGVLGYKDDREVAEVSRDWHRQ